MEEIKQVNKRTYQRWVGNRLIFQGSKSSLISGWLKGCDRFHIDFINHCLSHIAGIDISVEIHNKMRDKIIDGIYYHTKNSH